MAYFSTDGPLVNLSVDRTPSDDSLNSGSNRNSLSSLGNGIALPSPGSSSSPRSPISPSWNNDRLGELSKSSGEGIYTMINTKLNMDNIINVEENLFVIKLFVCFSIFSYE